MNRIYCLIDTMIWNKRISSDYFSSCIFPGFDRILGPGFHLLEFSGSLSFFKIGPVDIGSNRAAIKQVCWWWKEIFCSNENAPLSLCTRTQIFVSLPSYHLFGTPVELTVLPSFLCFSVWVYCIKSGAICQQFSCLNLNYLYFQIFCINYQQERESPCI